MAGQLMIQHLQRHVPVQAGLPGQIHRAHAAAPQQRDDLKARKSNADSRSPELISPCDSKTSACKPTSLRCGVEPEGSSIIRQGVQGAHQAFHFTTSDS